jgi:hypothetical protein
MRNPGAANMLLNIRNTGQRRHESAGYFFVGAAITLIVIVVATWMFS